MPHPRQRLLIITELFPNTHDQGLGNFVSAQVMELRQCYDITVITAHWTPLAKKLSMTARQKIQTDDVTVYSLSYYPWWIGVEKIFGLFSRHQAAAINKKRTAKKILALATRLHQQDPFDLVHGHEVYLGDEAGPIGMALHIPSVFTLHSLYEFHKQSFGFQVVAMASKNLQSVQKLLAVSHRAADTYSAHSTQLRSWEIVPNGVYQPVKTVALPVIADFAQGRPVLLSVGALAPDKRFDLSVRVVAKTTTPEAVLVVVGHGQELAGLKKLAQQLNCSDRILWLDAVPPAALPSIYAAADILVHPSVIESFSMVCLEAMAQGLAVITTTTIGLVEFVQPGHELLTVPPNNENELTVAIQNLLKNPAQRQAIAHAGQLRAQKMTWAVVADRLRTVYSNLHGDRK